MHKLSALHNLQRPSGHIIRAGGYLHYQLSIISCQLKIVYQIDVTQTVFTPKRSSSSTVSLVKFSPQTIKGTEG